MDSSNGKKVLFLTNSKIPTTIDAQAQRIISLISMFQESNVFVLSNSNFGTNQKKLISNNNVIFNSFKTNKEKNIIFKVLSRLLKYHKIKEYIESNRFDYIIFNDLSAAIVRLIKLTAKNNQ